jgi:hypothetical protein
MSRKVVETSGRIIQSDHQRTLDASKLGSIIIVAPVANGVISALIKP